MGHFPDRPADKGTRNGLRNQEVERLHRPRLSRRMSRGPTPLMQAVHELSAGDTASRREVRRTQARQLREPKNAMRLQVQGTGGKRRNPHRYLRRGPPRVNRAGTHAMEAVEPRRRHLHTTRIQGRNPRTPRKVAGRDGLFHFPHAVRNRGKIQGLRAIRKTEGKKPKRPSQAFQSEYLRLVTCGNRAER